MKNAANEYKSIKDFKDINFNETIKKAELEAIAQPLGDIANELVRFLEKI